MDVRFPSEERAGRNGDRQRNSNGRFSRPDAFEKNLMIAILSQCGLSQERIRLQEEQNHAAPAVISGAALFFVMRFSVP